MAGPRYKAPTESEIVDRYFVIKDQHDQPVVNKYGEGLVGAVLDSKSITKRNLGRMAYGTQLGIGIQQLLHPEIGAAVEHTQKFWQNPYLRVAVSMDPIMSVIYADDPYAAGEHVRRLHEGIHGKDHKGRSFNALSKDAFYWAHSTFQYGVENLADKYARASLTTSDHEQIQRESATWYSYYGMPMDMVPADHQANVQYRKEMLDTVPEMNPSAERAINLAVDRTPPRPEMVPKRIWALAKLALMPTTEVMSLLTIGELPVDMRKKFNIPFSADEQKHLDDIRTIAQAFLYPLPDPIAYYPKAYQDNLREHGGSHKNLRNRLIYRGGAVLASAVGKGVATAQSLQSKLTS